MHDDTQRCDFFKHQVVFVLGLLVLDVCVEGVIRRSDKMTIFNLIIFR